MRTLLRALLFAMTLAASASAEQIDALAWNVESGGADPETIADQIGAFAGYELLGFSEVSPGDGDNYASACTEGENANFEFVLGTTGGTDRLLLVWNSDRFELVEEAELMNLRAQTGRAPLAVRLRDRNSSGELWFMVNHLHRGNEAKRNEQATGIRDWMRDQTIPVIMCGDLNVDVDPTSGNGNEAFDILRQGGHAKAVPFAEMIPTQSSHHASVLDFFFVNDDAASWTMTAEIIKLPGGFEPIQEKSDHRPISLKIETPSIRQPRRRVPGFVDMTQPLHGAVDSQGVVHQSVSTPPSVSQRVAPSNAPAPRGPGALRERDNSETLNKIRLLRTQIDELERSLQPHQ